MLLGSHRFAVQITPSASKAIEIIARTRVHLVVASSRCPPSSVLELTEALGTPRYARVIVLIAGHDPEAEGRYRAAGLQYVLTMPVSAEDLLRAGS